MVEPGVPAVTVDPPEEAWPMLRLRSDEKEVGTCGYLIIQTDNNITTRVYVLVYIK